ncbi:MAG: hypothetical protein M5U26_10120 [Planctomycetota bacterium]|nr:hypothetical protein [Planctomycetota bacterium]
MPNHPPTFLITAGPTVEDIDPVRFISNRATGKLGFAVAQAGLASGHRVILIHGPVSDELDAAFPKRMARLTKVPVRGAAEMHRAVRKHVKDAQVVVMSAAVADYTIEQPSKSKLKKGAGELLLRLKPTADILAELGQLKRTRRPELVLIGFALETGTAKHSVARALERLREGYRKLVSKNLDALVLDTPAAMGADEAEFRVLRSANDPGAKLKLSKNQMARKLVALGEELWRERKAAR